MCWNKSSHLKNHSCENGHTNVVYQNIGQYCRWHLKRTLEFTFIFWLENLRETFNKSLQWTHTFVCNQGNFRTLQGVMWCQWKVIWLFRDAAKLLKEGRKGHKAPCTRCNHKSLSNTLLLYLESLFLLKDGWNIFCLPGSWNETWD